MDDDNAGDKFCEEDIEVFEILQSPIIIPDLFSGA